MRRSPNFALKRDCHPFNFPNHPSYSFPPLLSTTSLIPTPPCRFLLSEFVKMSPRDEGNARKPPGTKNRSESSTRRPETHCTPESKKRPRPAEVDQRDRISSDYDGASPKRQTSHHKRHRKEEKHRAKKHHKYLTPDRSSPDVKQEEPVMVFLIYIAG